MPAGFLARYLRYSDRMEVFGPDLGMPHTRAMGEGLFELRLKATEGIARVFYCTVDGKKIVVLHQFIKKTGKTPSREFETARRRMREVKKMLTHKELKARALDRADVKDEYDQLDDEFSLLDQFLKARSAAGITQAEVAERIGTTQSVIARLESGSGKHSPSLATLQKYANALGCRLEMKIVKVKSSNREKNHPACATKR